MVDGSHSNPPPLRASVGCERGEQVVISNRYSENHPQPADSQQGPCSVKLYFQTTTSLDTQQDLN